MQWKNSSQSNERAESKQEPSFSLPYLEMYGLRMIDYACRERESRKESGTNNQEITYWSSSNILTGTAGLTSSPLLLNHCSNTPGTFV